MSASLLHLGGGEGTLYQTNRNYLKTSSVDLPVAWMTEVPLELMVSTDSVDGLDKGMIHVGVGHSGLV